MIKVLAVDDEPLALMQMESYISKVPYLELVGACLNALEARSLLEEKVVDAMFLDINMPDLSGLEFVRSLDNPPLVVFTTAYSEYAIEGFKVEAVDYLLKPFGFGDFLAASERLKSRQCSARSLKRILSSSVPITRRSGSSCRTYAMWRV